MIRNWILASRPKTLPAAVIPVLVGAALAVYADVYKSGQFEWLAFMYCLLFAVFVQIGTNFANDYFDYMKGADTKERLGPKRMVSSGAISPSAMKGAMVIVLLLAFLLGLNLISYGGYPLIAVGICSILSAVAYTGGPFPLAYNGLGDVFVVFFFGIVAVGVTFFVQAGLFLWEAVVLGVAVGLLINNLLVVNNYRDVDEDRGSSKKTTAVRFGRGFALWQYRFSMLFASVIVPLMFVARKEWAAVLLMLFLPYGWKLSLVLEQAKTREQFGRLLGQTVMYFVRYGLILSILLLANKHFTAWSSV